MEAEWRGGDYWLRNFEEAPTAANINGLLERLRYVRGISIDPAIGARIPEFRFAQFMREGRAAPAFLLGDYSPNRRRATLIAAMIDLESRLADAAIQMFDSLIGGLGFRFVPRLRDIADRKLGAIAAPSTYKGIESLMGRTIKTAAIEADWDDIVRIVASIKEGAVAPSAILRKLAAYKRQNRLDFALAELGRIERTLFTLDWLEQPELRRSCQAGLNKGEARHTLAAAIYTNRQGRFTDRSLENQEYRASGLNLLIAAIAYWNTIYMDRAAQHLKSYGVSFDDALLAHLSPMGWAHISLTGDYLWQRASQLAPGEFRALSDPIARLKHIA